MALSSRQLRLMGTWITTTIDHDQPEPILDRVDALLRTYEQRFSANDASSELMAINHQAGLAPVQVAPDLFELIRLGKLHSCAPGSGLNVTIGPLVQTWRIGFSDARLPSPAELVPLLDLIDPQTIQLDEAQRSVFLPKKGMKLDLGALAKGYIADLVLDELKTMGVGAALINLGGNVLTYGPARHNEDGLWKIGIQHPRLPRGQNILVIGIRDASVVTSGIYERTFTHEGKTFHHIFDSQTGYPVETEVASLTIVSPLSVQGEIWTTRLFGQSPAEIIAQVEAQPDLAGLVISKSDRLTMSSKFLDKIKTYI